MAMRMVQQFGSRPRQIRASAGDVWELARIGYEERYLDRETERVIRMVTAAKEQQARVDGYRPQPAA